VPRLPVLHRPPPTVGARSAAARGHRRSGPAGRRGLRGLAARQRARGLGTASQRRAVVKQRTPDQLARLRPRPRHGGARLPRRFQPGGDLLAPGRLEPGAQLRAPVGLQADRVLRHLLLPEQHGGELRLRPIETPTRLAQLPPPPLRAPGRARPRLPLGHPGAALGGAGRRDRASATGRPVRTW